MAAVTGFNPAMLVAPDYQTQQMQAERRLAMAQQLQQMALQDTPGNGGSVSWTQGLARIADGLIGGVMAKKGYAQMQGANQAYAAGMARLFGMTPPQGQSPQGATPPQNAPQMPQGAPPAAQAISAPPMPPQAPQGAPAGPNADPLAPLPDQPQVAPPQAAPPPPAAPAQPQGGAPFFPTEPGMSQGQSMFHMMQDPEGYWKNIGAANSPTDFAKSLQQAGIDPNSPLGHQIMQAQVAKQNFIPPTSFRPGGWSQDASGKMSYHPQAPAPGSMPVMDANGQPTGAWTDDPSAAAIQAQQAGAVAGAQAGAKAPFDVVPGFQNGQPTWQSKAAVTGGSLNGHYYGPGNALPSGPPIGKSAAYDTYGKQSADAFIETQGISKESPQRVQALREMQTLIAGPNALATGPTAAKMQQLAEEHGLPFGYSSNAFVFNKDAARFVAQSASDLGLNGSDARLGMMAHASPNMTMTPQALKTVIPTMIGLEYAKMAKATAASTWEQSRGPDTNAQFESTWRQSYDPRMFTAYAQGGPQALANAPANIRQQWLKDYRQLKGMGVDFTQFAQ